MIRILVPLDGSPLAETALPVAATLARRAGAGLRLATVETPGSPVAQPPRWRPAQPGWLTTTGQLLEEEGLPVETRVVEGGVVEGALAEGAGEDVGLTVMTTRTGDPVGRSLHGSVTERLIRRAPWPVLALPAEATDTADLLPLGRVLVALDGSAWAEQALSRALPWLDRETGRLILVRVVGANGATAAPLDGESRETELREASAYLETHADRLRRDGWTVDVEVPAAREVVDGLLAAASVWDVNVLILASHGRTGILRAVLGNVAESILRLAGRPVMVVRPAEGLGAGRGPGEKSGTVAIAAGIEGEDARPWPRLCATI